MLKRAFMICLLLASPAVASAPLSTPTQHLKPADEGTQDPSFAAYRQTLRDAIARKDIIAVTKLMDPKIKLDFGGGEGIATFKANWKVTAKNTYVWKALSLIVDNGGHFNSKTQFAAPYVFSAWPDDVDAFEFVAITDPQAELFDGPHESRRTIRKVGYEIVQVLKGAGKPQHEAGEDDWSEVKTQDGKRGFVQARQYRSPIDYRAVFEKTRGRWRMTAFIAGD